MTTWQMYFITISDGLKNLFTFSAIILGLACIPFIIFLVTEDYDDKEPIANSMKKFLMFAFPIVFVLATFAVLIPTTKQSTAIMIIPKIANAERMDNVKPEFYDVALSWLKEVETHKE